MNEEVKMYMDEAKEQMQNALVHLENELAKIRADPRGRRRRAGGRPRCLQRRCHPHGGAV